jgi:cyclase
MARFCRGVTRPGAGTSLTCRAALAPPEVPANPSRHFRIEKLGAGVYAAVATPGGFGLCNAGIVDLGGETVVFDSMLTPMAGADLARAAVRVTGRRPAWVVNSHWHGDHIWGNSSFVGSHIVSSRKVRATIEERSRAQWKGDREEMRRELPQLGGPESPYPKADLTDLRGWFGGVLATPRSHRIVPPGITFADELALEGTRRSIRLLTYGGGHSPSDVFAFLPEERILFAGDLAMRGLHPSVSDGYPSAWISILRRMERLRVRSVVPGHGPIGPGSTLATTRTYLEDLERTARAAVRLRQSVHDLAKTPVPPKYRRWRFSYMYAGNLARAYRFARHRTGRAGR